MREIKKFNQLNENMFTFKKRTYKDKVISDIETILEDVHSISEKDFKRIDKMLEIVKNLFETNEFLKTTVDDFENRKARSRYCAEFIYDNTKDTLFNINL